MKNVIEIRDGHDHSGKRNIRVVLVRFHRPEEGMFRASYDDEFTGTRYFGLPAGVYEGSFTGTPSCVNVVETARDGVIQLGTASGGGPDINIGTKCTWSLNEKGGTLRREFKDWCGNSQWDEFDFTWITPGEVESLEKAWAAKDERLCAEEML